MPRAGLTPDLIDAVADRFKAMGEPARLRILSALRPGERCVTDLERDTGLNQANLSRHLQVLSAAGLVKRRKDGLFVYYALADSQVLKLCELMCGRIVTAPSAGTRSPRRSEILRSGPASTSGTPSSVPSQRRR